VPTAASAAQASTPRLVSLPGVADRRAVLTSVSRTRAACNRGARSSSSATTPETCAAAIELPEKKS
jgi:hypothetical protein